MALCQQDQITGQIIETKGFQDSCEEADPTCCRRSNVPQDDAIPALACRLSKFRKGFVG